MNFIDEHIEKQALPKLIEFVSIGNTSPGFSGDEKLELEAAQLLKTYAENLKIEGLKVEILKEKNRSALVLVDIPAFNIDEKFNSKTILAYGHFDKQPHQTGWTIGDATKPVIVNGRLYGRGSSDDGYAFFSYLTAILNLQKAGIAHSRFLILCEGCEESGSNDLDFYLDQLLTKRKLVKPNEVDFVVCFDSGGPDNDRLQITSSLRGGVAGTLSIRVLKEQIHSGAGTGIIPDPIRILRVLLDRIENSIDGKILVDEFYVDIHKEHLDYAQNTANVIGDKVQSTMPLAEGVEVMGNSNFERLINLSWKPGLTVIACDHKLLRDVPGSNVISEKAAFTLSIRIPPNCDPEKACQALKNKLLGITKGNSKNNVPYNAIVEFDPILKISGQSFAGKLSNQLFDGLQKTSNEYFGNDAQFIGAGGSIPVINKFQERFPSADILVSGVLTTDSNAHAIDENLQISSFKQITKCLSDLVKLHSKQLCN